MLLNANRSYPGCAAGANPAATPAGGLLSLDTLLEKVCLEGGYDFREYKRSTISRRLDRRLHAVGAGSLEAYARYLDGCPDEYRRLAEDLTIKVSGFFRSPYCFQQVRDLVLPPLLSARAAAGGRAVRFWSAACACGEEAYSLAIMLAPLRARYPDFSFAVIATDISQEALRLARRGEYPAPALSALPAAAVGDYFTPCPGGYRVSPEISGMVQFHRFDLTRREPISLWGVDCIFCCNVLIYMQRRLQERLLANLWHCLAADGYLVLGEAETPSRNLLSRLECLDSRARIYRKVSSQEG